MKYRVKDQLHISSLGPETMGKGTEFDVSKAFGDDLVKRGLAEAVEGDAEEEAPAPAKAPAVKAEPAPLNKADFAAPANKATPKGKAKAKA